MSNIFWVVNSHTLPLKAMWHSFISTKLPHIPLSLSLMWFTSSAVKTNSMADTCLTFYRNYWVFFIKGVPFGVKMFHSCFLKWRACNSGCVWSGLSGVGHESQETVYWEVVFIFSGETWATCALDLYLHCWRKFTAQVCDPPLVDTINN